MPPLAITFTMSACPAGSNFTWSRSSSTLNGLFSRSFARAVTVSSDAKARFVAATRSGESAMSGGGSLGSTRGGACAWRKRTLASAS